MCKYHALGIWHIIFWHNLVIIEENTCLICSRICDIDSNNFDFIQNLFNKKNSKYFWRYREIIENWRIEFPLKRFLRNCTILWSIEMPLVQKSVYLTLKKTTLYAKQPNN